MYDHDSDFRPHVKSRSRMRGAMFPFHHMLSWNGAWLSTGKYCYPFVISGSYVVVIDTMNAEKHTKKAVGLQKIKYKVTHYKTLQWIYCIAAKHSFSYTSNTLQVCAPRWRNSYYSVSANYYLMNGACYLTDDGVFGESKKETLLPLNDIGTKNCLYVCVCGKQDWCDVVYVSFNNDVRRRNVDAH